MSKLLSWFDRLHWLWLGLAAPFMLFPSPKRSLAMLVVPALWLLHWLDVSQQRRAALSSTLHPPRLTLRQRLSALRHKSPPNRGSKSAICDSQSSIRNPQSPIPNPQSAICNLQSAIPLTPLNGALLLLALMVLVSEWATFDLAYSLPKISGMVLAFGVFFAVAREGERERGWWLGLLAFLGMGLGVAALGVFGTHWATTKIVFLTPIVNRLPKFIAGLQGAESGFHPNEVAGALIWLLPVMMALSVGLILIPRSIHDRRSRQRHEADSKVSRLWGIQRRETLDSAPRKDFSSLRGWQRVALTALCLLATLFVGVVFVLTQSRGGYIGLALTLPLLILSALPRRWRWYSLIALVLLAILLGFLVASHWEAIRTWVTGSDLAADPALSLNTFEERFEIWSRAIYGIQDFPFTGMGMNAFRRVVPVLYPLFMVSPDVDIGHAHNEFLQAALDLGIPGLIAFIAIYIIAFWMLVEVWKKLPNSQSPTPNPLTPNPRTVAFHLERAAILGLGGGLLAHLLYGLTDAVALGAKPGLLFWMLLGLIAGLYNRVCSAVVTAN